MKDEALYELPEGWAWATLGEITMPIERLNRDYQTPNEKFEYIDIEAIDNNRNTIKESKKLTWAKAPSRAQLRVKINDVLFSTVRPYLKNIAIISEKNNDAIVSSGFCVLRTIHINPKYVFYYVLNQEVVDAVSKQAKGTSYPAITNSILMQKAIPLPSLDEQHRIISKIEELFAELRDAEESLNKAKSKLEIYKYVFLKEAFEGRLTTLWRKQNPRTQKIIRTKLSVKKGEVFPNIPSKWQMAEVQDVATVMMGQSPPGTSYNTNGIGTPLINGPLEFGPEPFSFTVLSKWTTQPTKKCEAGDLIVCVRGSTTGRQNIAGFEACLGRGVAAIRATKIEAKYLYHYFNYSRRKIFEMGTGTTFPSVSYEQLKQFLIPICSKEEQKSVVIEIEYRATIIDNLEETIINCLRKIEYYKNSILKKSFRGKLIISDSKSDETKELLNKIGNEKIEYLKNQMTFMKAKPKRKKLTEVKKSILQILQDSDTALPAKEVWLQSKHKDDIEGFYSELRELQTKITEIKKDTESLLTLRHENR